MLMVKKKSAETQKYRLALDLRKLNSVVQLLPVPLPKISDLVNKIAGYRFYTTLDMSHAFWQLRVPQEDRKFLAFTSIFGNYQYSRLVFGLKNSGAYFTKLMNKVLKDLDEKGVFAYLDDIIVVANDFEEMLERITEVFQRLRSFNLTLSPTKCRFYRSSINYLGYKISAEGIQPIDENIQKINSFPIPRTVRQVRKFLGICNYYRGFIKNCAEILQPIEEILRKGKKFKFSQVCEESFKKIKKIFLSSPFMLQPSKEKTFFLNTDASKIAISAVLCQEVEGILRPVRYFSRRLNGAEQKYESSKMELLAIIEGVKQFKDYLYGRNFVILSDHEPLKFFLKLQNPAPIIARWLLFLSEFQYDFQHIPGSKNLLADYLSRVTNDDEQETVNKNLSENQNDKEITQLRNEGEIDGTDRCAVLQAETSSTRAESAPRVEEKSDVLTDQERTNNTSSGETSDRISSERQKIDLQNLSTENIRERSKADSEILRILEGIDKGKLPFKQDISRFYLEESSGLLMHLGKVKGRKELVPQIVLPKILRKFAIQASHMTHLGSEKTYQCLIRKYWWQRVYADTRNYVNSCHVCGEVKPNRQKRREFGNNPIPKEPGEFLSIDICGRFPTGFYVVSFIDNFSRRIQLYPVRNIKTETVAEAILKYMTAYGKVKYILSDRGGQFTSEITKSLGKRLNICNLYTTSYNPKCNAKIERIHGSLKNTIKALGNEIDFKLAVNLHAAYYNNSVHPATGFSPNQLFFGRDLKLLTDNWDDNNEDTYKGYNVFYHRTVETLSDMCKQARENMEKAQLKQNLIQRAKSVLTKIKCGDTVYLDNSTRFRKRFSGPFEVVRVHSNNTVTIESRFSPDTFSKKVNVARLKVLADRREHLK